MVDAYEADAPLQSGLMSEIAPVRFFGTPVTVLGAGVSGLTCAIRLREAGYPVTIITERQTPQTTSDRAGACFTPYGAPTNTRMSEWIRTSFRKFTSLAASPSGLHSGVSMASLRHFGIAGQEEFPWWAGAVSCVTRLPNVPEVTNGAYAHGWHARLPRIDIPTYMPWLRSRFVDEFGGHVEIRRIPSFVDLLREGRRFIINCSGFGARELCHDPHMSPMRGQVIRIANTIGLDECLVEAGRGTTGAYVFAFPETLVIGGTYEKGADVEATEEAELQQIVHRCSRLVLNAGYEKAQADGLARAPRIRSWAGIRPCRCVGSDDEAVRLEPEYLPEGRAIIHNYGHGRSGITLSWGCAEEVLKVLATAAA